MEVSRGPHRVQRPLLGVSLLLLHWNVHECICARAGGRRHPAGALSWTAPSPNRPRFRLSNGGSRHWTTQLILAGRGSRVVHYPSTVTAAGAARDTRD